MLTMEELERRVVALEKANVTNTATMKWLSGTLGEIQATVDDHTERLVRIEEVLLTVKEDLTAVEKTVRFIQNDITSLRRDLPGIVTSAIRTMDR